MNINDIESKHLKSNDKPLIRQNQSEAVDESDEQPNHTPQSKPYVRSYNDWALIVKLMAAVSVCVGLILGLIGGFVVGRLTASPTYTKEETPNETTSIYDQYDYTQFVINADKNVTIDSFYSDNEEKYYAMNLIGTKLPTLSYLNQAGETLTTEAFGNGNYIIEFFEPTCTFCQSMIDDIDAYRDQEGSLTVLGLSIAEGDLSDTFNKNGEHSFTLIQKDEATENLISQIAWIPTFVYVSNGSIELVTFGVMTAEDIENNISIAFG